MEGAIPAGGLPAKPVPPLVASTLYLVATPIGNLEDITQRALRVLRECDGVLAEDTRRTGQLLNHFGISKSLISYHRFNEARRCPEIVERLRAGGRWALVSDAGTPGISDPGERLVRAVIGAGLKVESVPGPCAMVVALSASGLPTREFHFVGFLSQKSARRRREIERLKAVPGTLVLYESPYRVGKLLDELSDLMPEREVVIARELTKKFEEFLRGTPAELRRRTAQRSWKGEVTVLIGPAPEEGGEPEGESGTAEASDSAEVSHGRDEDGEVEGDGDRDVEGEGGEAPEESDGR